MKCKETNFRVELAQDIDRGTQALVILPASGQIRMTSHAEELK